MYFSCSFLNVLVILVFLSFCVLAFVGFLLISKNAFVTLSHFSQTAIYFHRTQDLAVGLVGIDSDAASMWVVKKKKKTDYKMF